MQTSYNEMKEYELHLFHLVCRFYVVSIFLTEFEPKTGPHTVWIALHGFLANVQVLTFLTILITLYNVLHSQLLLMLNTSADYLHLRLAHPQELVTLLRWCPS